jgi:hypothetical protein
MNWMHHHEIYPYIATKAVTERQLEESLQSGLTVSVITDRLLNAECFLCFGSKKHNESRQQVYARFLSGEMK